MWRSKPSYLSQDQAQISSQVPDDEDGVTAFAEAEQTAWQLSKSSIVALGPNAIATKSGPGRWLEIQLVHNNTSPNDLIWNLNGDIHLADVGAGAPVGDGGPGFFDGTRLIVSLNGERITLLSAIQRCSGANGFTTVEVWRLRAGVYTLLSTLALPFGVPFTVANAPPPPGPDDILIFGDMALVRLISKQDDDGILSPCDLTVNIHTEVQP